jgi:hypothetical protein
MDTDRSKTYILFGREVSAILADNNTDLPELLVREEPYIEARMATDPSKDAGGSKDLGAVLIATAALAVGLTPLLLRVLARLTLRPVLVTELVLVPVEDSAGQVVTGADSEPILQWVERARFVVPDSGSEQFAVSIKAVGLQIELGPVGHG